MPGTKLLREYQTEIQKLIDCEEFLNVDMVLLCELTKVQTLDS